MTIRKIIHIDCDCFYAAVEIRDRPELQQLPVAVGGSSRRRGVLTTCNYIAREYGLHSAMSTAEALRRCPQLVLIPPEFDKYRQVSAQIHEILGQYTSIIEPLSLDEAYLDVTNCDIHNNSATLIAESIRQKVKTITGITVSAGVAPNKFLAKVASDWNKPDGLCVITPGDVSDFVKSLPVKKIPGVGKVGLRKLQQLGIENCLDLQNTETHLLIRHFGKFGLRLKQLSTGQDNREVKTERIRKSLSVEHTFANDLHSVEDCLLALPELLDKMHSRLDKIRKKESYFIHKLFIKIKFSDFTLITRETSSLQVSEDSYRTLISHTLENKMKPVRLLGIGMGLDVRQDPRQLDLLNGTHEDIETGMKY